MKNRLLVLSFLSVLLLALLVSPQSVDVVETNVDMIVSPGDTQTASFTVDNLGSANITLNITHNLDLIDNDGDQITLSFSDPGTLAPGSSAQVTITADADPRIDIETYTGTVTVEDTASGETDQFQLTITVEPDICDFGEAGDDLILDIEDPEDNEEFEPGDTIDIDVSVENVGDDDIRTQVGALLFSDKAQITNTFSETKNIADGDEEDFKLSLAIPLDSREIDEDDDFTLFVKAFDDDNEQLNCIQDKREIKITLPTRKVLIDEEGTRFLPTTASCGDTVIANVHVINIGSKDNDHVAISISNSELSISERSDAFSLDAFTANEDNDATRQFTLAIPADITGKRYFFTVNVDYEGGSVTHQVPLDVFDCETPKSLIERGKVLALVSPVNTKIVAAQGSFITIPVKVTNKLDTKENLIVALTNLGDLGTSAPKTILLGPNQESTLFLDVQIKDDAQPGIHTAVIEVRLGGLVIASETVAVELGEPREEVQTAGTLFSKVAAAIPWPVWIIINLIVIGVLIIIIQTIVKNRKH